MADNKNINNIVDLDLSVTSKKKFRFNGDDNRIVEIDTSDLSIVSRLSEFYPKLVKAAETASKTLSSMSEDAKDEDLEKQIKNTANKLGTIDTEMRELIDTLFDAPVSAAAAPTGSMYDPFEGSFRFEHILDVVLGQYLDNIQEETKKIKAQVKKHTDKYTSKRKK